MTKSNAKKKTPVTTVTAPEPSYNEFISEFKKMNGSLERIEKINLLHTNYIREKYDDPILVRSDDKEAKKEHEEKRARQKSFNKGIELGLTLGLGLGMLFFVSLIRFD